jgi:glyoxylase-like metal-dependent hydrolase (beta-lactamase superfamily II)
MVTADEFQIVDRRLAVWQAYAPSVKCELSSCALFTGAGLIFVDPIPLAAAALEELVEAVAPVAIVLTNGNHARAAAFYRKRFSIPIVAHSETVPGLKEEDVFPDHQLADGEEIVPGLKVIRVPGAGPGEIALHLAAGIMVMGDALIHLEPLGFGFLPEKYCADFKAMRAGLRNLLRFEFDLMTFAHGLPLVVRARPTLESLLA